MALCSGVQNSDRKAKYIKRFDHLIHADNVLLLAVYNSYLPNNGTLDGKGNICGLAIRTEKLTHPQPNLVNVFRNDSVGTFSM